MPDIERYAIDLRTAERLSGLDKKTLLGEGPDRPGLVGQNLMVKPFKSGPHKNSKLMFPYVEFMRDLAKLRELFPWQPPANDNREEPDA